MDAEKLIKQNLSARKKTMNELIEDKHNKNKRDLDKLSRKWLENNKKTP